MENQNKLYNKMEAISKSYFKLIIGGISGVFTSISILFILKWTIKYQETMNSAPPSQPYDKIAIISGSMFLASLLLVQAGFSISVESRGLLSKVNWLGMVAGIVGMVLMIMVMGDAGYSSINWIMLSAMLLITWFVVIMDIYYACIFLFDKFNKLGDTEKLNIIIPVITLIIGAMLGNR
ncbi:hypothetical protein [Carnobacterium divergens]|uniref:Uncharacterized protein n=1 Tax=Carnobacterium divergens DSM 20623 TaxID=1449336 RepID=A0A0R2HMS2_CARDV|nr:hypothetical protein [Carnobacterium divergens]KRN54201.1 hypothetical protein IV74_GL001779 [Carnobacterium divergens DSM 20623]MDO0873688.1 hypothetical protein [Carnobacterium divergens]SUX18879.1 Uncharacterised protein [Carnobacterium divergens]